VALRPWRDLLLRGGLVGHRSGGGAIA